MASIRSKIINRVVQILTFITFRNGISVDRFRQLLAKPDAHKKGALASGISSTEQSEPSGRWLKTTHTNNKNIILYLHGGAFIMRTKEMHSEMVSRLCIRLEASAFMPWYRLAPEHPFPAAIDDSLIAYQYLLKEHQPENIYIMGDSAGGNLTLSLLNLIKQQSLPMPRAAIALSPITDFAQISSTWLMHKWIEPMFSMKDYTSPQLHYLQGENILNPIASPYYGDLTDLPPLLLVVGGIEALRDDSVAYVRKAIEHGVNAQVHIWNGMPHVHMLMPMLPEQKLAEEEIDQWLKNLPAHDATTSREALWPRAVTLFNRRPLWGSLTQTHNGDEVLKPLKQT